MTTSQKLKNLNLSMLSRYASLKYSFGSLNDLEKIKNELSMLLS